jgi:hypothetical protein
MKLSSAMYLLARMGPGLFSSINRIYGTKIRHFLKSKDNSPK